MNSINVENITKDELENCLSIYDYWKNINSPDDDENDIKMFCDETYGKRTFKHYQDVRKRTFRNYKVIRNMFKLWFPEYLI